MNELDVSLFENRHNWPLNVTDSVFPSIKGGYNPRNFEVFETIAKDRLSKWKEKGIKIINLYLSGLTAATIAVLNAAYSLGIYIRLYHYTSVTNTWIEQKLLALNPPDITDICVEYNEKNYVLSNKALENTISNYNSTLINTYVNIFNKIYMHYDPTKHFWKDVTNYINMEYLYINNNYINLMEKYFNKNTEGTYLDELRRRIEYDERIGKRPKLPIKSSSYRRNRKKRDTHNYF